MEDDRQGAPSRAEIDDVVVSYVALQDDTIPDPLAFNRPDMSVRGTSRHFPALQDLVAVGDVSDIEQAAPIELDS
jgi:hypothetical protein